MKAKSQFLYLPPTVVPNTDICNINMGHKINLIKINHELINWIEKKKITYCYIK